MTITELKYPERHNWFVENYNKYIDVPYKRYALEAEYYLMARDKEPETYICDTSYVFTRYDRIEEPSQIESNVYVKNLQSGEMIWFGRFTNSTFIFNEPLVKEVTIPVNTLGLYSTEWYSKFAKSGEYEVMFDSKIPKIVLEDGAIGYIDKITGLPVYYDQYIL